MGRTLDTTDAGAIDAIKKACERFVCLVVLFAVRDGAEIVRFEKKTGAWHVLARQGGNWEVYEPIDQSVAVACAIKTLAKPWGLWHVVSGLWSKGHAAEFVIRLGLGAAVQCTMNEVRPEECIDLSLRTQGNAADRAEELLTTYLQLRGYLDQPF